MIVGRLFELLGGLHAVMILIVCVLATTRPSAQSSELHPSIPAAGPITQAQIAERPVWKAGFKWTFHQVAGIPAVESDFSREVTKSLPDGQFSVLTDAGKELVFDGETNSLDSRGPDYSWKRFTFPLFVGKQWSYKRRIGNEVHDGYETTSWEVKRYEKITVPAGTFDCFRVEGVAWRTETDGVYAPTQAHQDWTYWYCPTVNWFARMKLHASTAKFSLYIDSVTELTSFSVDR